MDYILKKVNKEDNYNTLVLAYYNFYEKLYGKNLSSLHVKRELSSGKKVSPVYMFIDSNYNLSRKTIDECEKVYHATMVGAFDEHDGLSAVSRVRFVMDNNMPYACIAEIIPTNPKDAAIKTDVVNSFEHYLVKQGNSEMISFEVPRYDVDFQKFLLDSGYNVVLSDISCPTLLFEKPLERELTHK